MRAPAGSDAADQARPYGTNHNSSVSLETPASGSGSDRTLSRYPSFGMSGGTLVEKPDYSEAKIVVAMVGLPARGKSYLSNKLTRYLLVCTLAVLAIADPSQWLEYEVRLSGSGKYC